MIRLKFKLRNIISYLILIFSFMSSCSLFQGEVGTTRWVIFYYGNFILLILLAFYVMLNHKKDDDYKSIKYLIYLFCMPRIIILLYSCLIWITSSTQLPYISRGISNNLYQCIAYFCGILFCYGEKDDILDITLLSLVTVYFISYSLGFINHGLTFIRAFNPFSEISYIYKEYVELHELSYIAGLYIILYIMLNKKANIKVNKRLIIISIICFVISWKRIGVLALTIAIIFFLLVEKIKPANVIKIIKISGFAGILICLAYVSIIINGKFVTMLNNFNIDSMGRNIIYAYFSNFSEFSIKYLGYGAGFVSRQFDYTKRYDLYNMISIKALHNDLFKMFIEIGFWGFIMWSFLWLVRIPRLVYKKNGSIEYLICFSIILYTFIVYTTDNIESYTNYQMHLSTVISYIYLYLKNTRIHSTKRISHG